jgi:acylphosphatase
MVDRLHVFIAGRVQGVGFRYSTARQATALGLTGWVRNLPDGRVEAEFEGPKPALDDMLGWCREGPALAHVTDVTLEWESGEARYDRFSLRGF